MLLGILMAAGSLAGAQSLEVVSNEKGHFFVEVHQVTPAEGLRDVDSRGGWGGQIGIEGQYLRCVLEAGGFPAQGELADGRVGSTLVATWGAGLDGILRLTDRRDGSLYLLGGVHFDKWSGRRTQGDPSTDESSQSGHLGLRVGAGLRLGPVFGEVRWRVTEGDLRVSSAEGRGGVWSAVEVGVGLRF